MTEPTNPKLDVIRKLLAKAEDPGTTPAERDALAEKAGALMIKYGIDEAVARAAATGEVRVEEIVRKLITIEDIPQSYSHEFAVLGARVAETLGARGILAKGGRRTGLYVIGYASDVALICELYKSLAIQCNLSLAVWYRRQRVYLDSGTDRYNAKRGFINGFTTGVSAKLSASRTTAVKEAGHGAQLVLVDRLKKVNDWLNTMMRTTETRGRRYDRLSSGAGYAAGQRANVGQGTVGTGVPQRPAIGG